MDLESKLERILMWEGKKNEARKILREAAERVVREKKKGWEEQLQLAVEEAGPGLNLRSRRRGSQKVKVPFPMTAEQRRNLGMRWLVEEARKTGGSSMGEKLAKVIMETAEGKGKVVERVRNQHKEVERNRGNAFLRW